MVATRRSELSEPRPESFPGTLRRSLNVYVMLAVIYPVQIDETDLIPKN